METLLNRSPKEKLWFLIMLCSNRPTRRLQLISNIFRRESKPPPPSSLMMRLTEEQEVEEESCCGSTTTPIWKLRLLNLVLFLGSEATGADVKCISSITPGTLLIILAGRFKGKRHSLLVSPDMFLFCNWPFKINDCHVLKVSDVSLDKYDDQYFGKVGEKKNKKGEGESLMEPSPLYFFTSFLFLCVLPSSRVLTYTLQCIRVFEAEREKVSTHREKDDQMAVDGALIKAIEVVSELNTCLCTVFIAQGMEPHKLVF
ncbi:hypothetical protein HID58_067750 [Brassica napus]|uniref:60S ribosomal protein L6 n=1 Tax=Brassica napus TaxID=3708 RepID=A0ABQ7ZJZ6_BRANA|nr:hypothetical protein HID58_067750 [Brassica napus]